MSRYRAAAIHLGLSALIFCALAYLVVFVWYPDFFFETDGGWEGMRIIVLVDLVIGPLLTLIVFKSGKPGLRVDLSIIAALQLACLIGGVWVVESQRPLAIVYVDGQFFSVSRDDFVEANIQVPDFSQFPGHYPKWISVALPDDPTKQGKARARALKWNVPLRLATEFYKPFMPGSEFAKDAYSVADIEDRDWEKRIIPSWLEEHGGTISDYRFYLFGARYKYVFLGFRSADNSFAGLLDVAGPYAPESTG